MRILARYVFYLAILISGSAAYGQSSNAGCTLVVKTAAIDGGLISYLEGGKGEPVLLLHGLFAQKEQWTEVACALANTGFDVIVPDLPGYGASTGFLVSDYPLESQVRILQHLMNGKQVEKFHIAGSSMGALLRLCMQKNTPIKFSHSLLLGRLWELFHGARR